MLSWSTFARIKPSTFLAVALVLVVAAIVIINVLSAIAFHYPYLRNDDWNFYNDYRLLGALDFLIFKYFGHPWLVSKLFYIAHMELFPATRLPVVLTSIGLTVFVAALLSLLLWQHRGQAPWAVSLSACALVTGSVLWMSRHLEWTWVFMMANPVVAACATVAAWGLYRHIQRPDPAPLAGIDLWFCLAIVMGILGSFNFSAGIAIWPAMVLAMIIYRLPWLRVAILIAIASVVVTVYAQLPTTAIIPMTLSFVLEIFPGPADVIRFFLILLGTAINFALFPFEGLRTGNLWLSGSLALAGVVLLLGFTWKIYRRDDPPPAVIVVPLMLSWFAMIAALMAALGRAGMDGFENPNDYRYATWSATFWSGLLWIALYHYLQHPTPARTTYLFLPAAMAVTGVFALASVHGINHLLDAHYKHQLGGLSMMTAPAIRINHARHLSPTHVERRIEVIPELRAKGYNPFGEDWPHRLGRNFSGYYKVAEHTECTGIWRLHSETARSRSQLYEGWATGPSGSFDTVLLVAGDVLVGGGKPAWLGDPRRLSENGKSLPGPARYFTGVLFGHRPGWIGITNMTLVDHHNGIEVYGLLGERTVCKITPA